MEKESYSELCKIFDNIILPESLSSGYNRNPDPKVLKRSQSLVNQWLRPTKQNTNMVKIEVIGKKDFTKTKEE